MHDKAKSETPKRETWRWMRRLLPVCFAVAVTMMFGTADAWAKGTAPIDTQPPAQSQAAAGTQAPAQMTETSEFASYAQREASTQGLEQFQGGSVVIITTTGVVIVVLLVVLILVLL